jgi:tRNA1(Val) A37 N6-methylase TrmN6
MKKIFLAMLVCLWLLPGCNVVFNISAVGIIIKQGTKNLANKTGKYNFGSSNWATRIDVSNADVKLFGEDAGDEFGCSVSGN